MNAMTKWILEKEARLFLGGLIRYDSGYLETPNGDKEMSCARLTILALFITRSSLDNIQGTYGTENRNEGKQGPRNQ